MQANEPQPLPPGHPPETEIATSPKVAPAPTEQSIETPPPAGAHDTIPTGNVDQFPGLAEQLRLAEQKAAEHHDAWLRARAETENVRRRAQEDIARTHKFAIEKFAAELLAVKDSLEAALANQNQSAEALHAGVELTLRQLVAAFEKSALVEINPLGQKFDPHRHQAMGMLESEQEPNTVVTVLQKGYLIADRILRPAMVMVAKAKTVENPATAPN